MSTIPTTTTTTTTTSFPPEITITPDSGYFGNFWPNKGSIPTSFSSAGWSLRDRGFVQQTFLGASIRSFSMNGGFGDSSSTLSVELVNDEFNKSDNTTLGDGDDPYHSGNGDRFIPPPVGSPVFFKFGMNFATVEEAYIKTFDDLYGTNILSIEPDISSDGPFDINSFVSLADNKFVDFESPVPRYVNANSFLSGQHRGKYHLVFGGILQSYTQNKGMGGNPLFSVNVTDPREILSNVVLILNNYSGSTFYTNNMLNIYGFLEHNATDATINQIKQSLDIENRLRKTLNNFNSYTGYTFTGNDTYVNTLSPNVPQIAFPITGTGMSRRGQQGIPYYRIKQAVNALMEFQFKLPEEYIQMGFGGPINFRGYNYVIDFGSLPDLNDLYFFDFDQINLLDLALEICDISSTDLFVTLLPITNHPRCSNINLWNTQHVNDPTKFIAGIIRLDAIDRSKQPNYGAIKHYIDGLADYGVYTENQDVGFELTNIVTDKFIVGAQEIDLHFFTSNSDRNNLGDESIGDQWKLETSFKQQILPYYGLLGNNAVTIPKGYGAYQQILLDATSLNANGVGSYYVATEMELRCALVSFERWKDFLKLYNDIYLESVEDNDAVDSAGLLQSPNVAGLPPVDDISNNYSVTVPRSVFVTYAPQPFGTDGLPYSPCNPPYGYPLYYKRMTKIGIPEGGLVDIQYRFSSLLSGLAGLKSADKSNFKTLLFSEIERLNDMIQGGSELNEAEKTYLSALENIVSDAENATEGDTSKMISILEDTLDNFKPIFYSADLSKIAKRNIQNALKVYNFVRNVAEECLGKKFLIKLPKIVNPYYATNIAMNGSKYDRGPFGFKPRAIGASGGFGQEFSPNVTPYSLAVTQLESRNTGGLPMSKFFLSSGTSNGRLTGELNVNFNPILDQYEFNYSPVNEGGFFNFDLYQNFITNDNIGNLLVSGYQYLPSGMQNQLIPIDLTNFINDNSRISPYVRFNHSEDLSFDGFNASDFTQNVATAQGQIPNLSYDLDNVHPDDTYSLQNNNNASQQPSPPQVAYVKCSVDDKLYMAPKTIFKSVIVYGQYPVATKTLKAPRKIYDACADKYVDSFSYYKSTFHPGSGDGATVNILDFIASSGLQLSPAVTIDGMLINTNASSLDTDNVYALITLPGRVLPTKDARLRDGPFQSSNAEKFKHFMTMDVVKGLDGFNIPANLVNPPKSILNDPRYGPQIFPNNRIHAWLAAKKANDSLLSFGLPKTLNYTFPSPVYPDLVALPLMSKDRCYGPWISSYIDTQAIRYKNIGGKIDFVKDENLSPWNYCGYDLMHRAGRLQAEFSNSLLFSSERGGFVIPAAPINVSLGKELLSSGPLVTNIQVDVSDAGVRTTYKMDLYTASFGKLQKQKQDQISKMSRDRQKLKDERNALIRKGLGKNQTSINYLKQYEDIQRRVNVEMSNVNNSAGVGSAPTVIAITNRSDQERAYSMEQQAEHTRQNYSSEGSVASFSDIQNVLQGSIGEDGIAAAYMNSAATPITQMFTAASNEPFHPNMASRQDPRTSANKSLYFNEDTPFSEKDVV